MPENFLLDGSKVEHSTEIFRLRGVRLAIASETRPDGKFNESRVKMLTGEPVLSARAMRENFVDFPATHTLFLALNHPPTVRSGGDGFWRRIRKIDFNHQVPEGERNPNLPAEIVAAEGPAILAWMVEGARRVLQEGLIEPESVTSATQEYRSEEDHIATWMRDCAEINPTSVLSSNSIYASYLGWCKTNTETPTPVVSFFRDLRQRFPLVPTKIGRERGYRGLFIYFDREDEGFGRRY
jgi:Predicted ATPase